MKTREIYPSDLFDWSEIDQTKAKTDSCAGTHHEWYGWYQYSPTGFRSDMVYLPHRKPTIDEMNTNKFK